MSAIVESLLEHEVDATPVRQGDLADRPPTKGLSGVDKITVPIARVLTGHQYETDDADPGFIDKATAFMNTVLKSIGKTVVVAVITVVVYRLYAKSQESGDHGKTWL